MAPPDVLDEVNTALDCLQICAPRSAQLAIYPLLPNLRHFVQETAQSLTHKHRLFKSLLPNGWKIGSQGAYYAFVEHPFTDKTSLEICERLAVEGGILTLPVDFFMPASNPRSSESSGPGTHWIRFSVANISDDKIRQVCERLGDLQKEFGWDSVV